MVALVLAAALAAPLPPCSSQLDGCVSSCQGSKSPNSQCSDTVAARYDGCCKLCKQRYPAHEPGTGPCYSRCSEARSNGEKSCTDGRFDCMKKCLAKPCAK